MASITHDGRSFTINGRRRFLFGVTIDLGRHARDRWDAILDDAAGAGFNTVALRLNWAMHQPEPGRADGAFDFTGDLDAASFLRQVATRKMLAVLRPGPFVGAGYDAGGLPGWLVDGRADIARTGDPVFKNAVSRWITAVMRQVGSLQILSPGAGGPIALIQNEHAWFKGHDDLAQAYLGEVARFLREAGARVPILNANNLFASPHEGHWGELDAWVDDHADKDPFVTLRQLHAVRPDSPPILLDLPLADTPAFGEQVGAAHESALRRIGLALAAGGQVFVDGMFAGLTPGFLAGRDPHNSRRYFNPHSAPGAPVSYSGARTPTYSRLRRLVTFAACFERVLANLDPAAPAVTCSPAIVTKGAAVIHRPGALGDAIFIFPAPGSAGVGPVELLLADGRPITVDPAREPMVPLLLNATLSPHAVLDYSNLSPMALVERALVLVGAPGAPGVFSINGAEVHTAVPSGRTPTIIEHEGLTVAVCSFEQSLHIVATQDAIHLGADRIDYAGLPVAAATTTAKSPGKSSSRASSVTTIRSTGAVEKTSPAPASAPRRAPAPTLSDWTFSADPALDADPAAAANEWSPAQPLAQPTWEDPLAKQTGRTRVEQPSTVAATSADGRAVTGYRWLRCRCTAGKPVRGNLGLFTLRDRGVVFCRKAADTPPARLGVVGDGPDTDARTVPLALGKGDAELIFLIDHLGRPAGGSYLGEPVGLVGEPGFVSAFRLTKPKLEPGTPVAPLSRWPARVWDLHEDEHADPLRITWSFVYRKAAPMYLRIADFPAAALVLLNDGPIAWVTPGDTLSMRIPEEPLRRGANSLQLAILGDAEAVLARAAAALSLYETRNTLPGTPAWTSSPWRVPPDDRFTPATPGGIKSLAKAPAWFRARFSRTPDDAPVGFVPTGLHKGCVMVNGRVLGRYIAGALGRRAADPVPTPVPPAWLRADEPNELTIFDEAGSAPDSCRLVAI